MKRISLVCALFTFLTVANAGILIEPYVGYGLGSGETGGTEWDMSGLKFGGRLGYEKMGLFGALQYEMGAMTKDASGTESDVDDSSFGIVVGYQFPFALRAWAGYGFSGTVDDAGSEQDYTTITLGVGYKPIPGIIPMADIFINAEYRMISLDGAADADSASEIFLSIGVPFNI